MSQFGQLHDDPLTSCDGRHVLGYDSDHVATLVDTATGEATWRAGAPGTLTLGYTAVEVRDSSYELVWTSDLEHPDADALRVTDSGDLELLSTERVRLVNSRTGAVETAVLRGSAPVSAITETAHLVRTGRLDGTSWVLDGHAGCAATGADVGRGDTLLPGQSLRRQSLTSADGTVVFAHRDDKRLVLHAADGTWQWDRYLGADDTSLVLDDDGVLRVRGVDGGVVLEIAGPADALVVTSEGVELRRDGVAFWRDGASVRARRRTGAGSGA